MREYETFSAMATNFDTVCGNVMPELVLKFRIQRKHIMISKNLSLIRNFFKISDSNIAER